MNDAPAQRRSQCPRYQRESFSYSFTKATHLFWCRCGRRREEPR